MLVYFVGGCTFAEVAAVRFLNKLFKDKQFVVATTQIINGDNLLNQFSGNVESGIDLSTLAKK